MTSPREQAIEEIQNLYDRIPTIRGAVRSIITDYEKTRARLDGAKMMPRDADETMRIAGGCAIEYPSVRVNGPSHFSKRLAANCHRAMHDATPKDGER